MSPEVLSRALRQEGFVVNADRLAPLPVRFPATFALSAIGEICLAEAFADGSADDDDFDLDDMPGVSAVRRAAPCAWEETVVLEIETSGLDRSRDHLTEWALVRLNGTVVDHCHVEVQGAERDGGDERVPLRRALESLQEALGGFELVVGQNLLAFDLPFIDAVARRGSLPWKAPAVVADLIDLSLLDAPELVGRHLFDLCEHYGVPLAQNPNVVDRASAAARLVLAIANGVSGDEPAWQLALACLHEGDHAWAGLLPAPTDPEAFAAPYVCRTDELMSLQRTVVKDSFDRVRSSFAAMSTKGFKERPAQREMAERVRESLSGAGHIAIEAPTGTGKSLGYLIPSVACSSVTNEPIVIATHTKNLQQQLRRDAELLAELGLLSVPFRQIQGVANYVCARELSLTVAEPESMSWFACAVAARALAVGTNGTWDDVTDDLVRRRDAGYSTTRALLRTTASGCERSNCEFRTSCPLMARVASIKESPGVISVNHAVIAAWVKVMRTGGTSPGDVLGEGRAALVFDEAHTLEDSLTSAWTDELDGLTLDVLALGLLARRGLYRRAGRVAKKAGLQLSSRSSLRAQVGVVRERAEALTAAVKEYVHEYGGREAAAVLAAGIVTSRPEFTALRRAANDARFGLRGLRAKLIELETEMKANHLDAGVLRVIAVEGDRIEEVESLLESLAEVGEPHLFVHSLSVTADDEAQWRYARIPVHITPAFNDEVVARSRSVVLTSATLTVERSFDFVAGRLGIQLRGAGTEGFDTLSLSSPFDHAANSLLLLTNHLPVPVPSNEREFCEEFAADQVGFLSLSGGKAMSLFASRVRMNAVAAKVRDREAELADRGVELLVQGEQGRTQMQRRFRNNHGTVLYGLRSYWEGFDAPGETLSYLFIEKPPYPHPHDPLVAARQRAVADRGGDPFLDYVLPLTSMLFTQGFGRLIRNETDRGAALVMDRRLHSPGVARRVLIDSLPGPQVVEAIDREDAWTRAIEFVTGTAPDLSTALLSARDDATAIIASLQEQAKTDPEGALRRGALELFQIEELHDAQVAIMLGILEGRDAVGVLPTGFGKSICFQLPAIVAPTDEPTVVVSPLVALIKDQLDDLRARRGIRSVQGITGATSRVVQTEILRDVAAKRVRLLYVSPERLARDPVLRGALGRQALRSVVVDEAHCISVWGHDFRPEFRQIPRALKSFEQRSSRVAFTATATPEVEADIEGAMEMVDPLVVRESVDRPNLCFQVRETTSERHRDRDLLRFVTHVGDAPGIVYTSKRSTAEEIAALLRRAGRRARHYHAGMVPEQREAVQDDFLADTTQIIVATKAFGMGINKSNLQWVVHYDLPDSLDGYAQEAGRAGRDRRSVGECLLLFTKRDIARRRGQLGRVDTSEMLAVGTKLLELLHGCPQRAGSVVFDSDEISDALGIEPDDLNVHLARLEAAGALERELDATSRGMLTMGAREPDDEDERRLFRDLKVRVLKARPNERKQIDFAELQETHKYDPDELEDLFIGWSLERLVTFHATQRRWRVSLKSRSLDRSAFLRQVEAWGRWQRRRLNALIDYATSDSVCRRTLIARHFGDPARDCATLGAQRCDVCLDDDADWLRTPDHLVPDPEELVNVPLVILQAVAWTAGYTKGRYGEGSLKAALLGQDGLFGDERRQSGLAGCPQFGALRHVRNGASRWDSALQILTAGGLVERVDASWNDRRYHSLVLTDRGAGEVGVRR